MKEKLIKATKAIAIVILLLSIVFIIALGVKALDNSKIDIAELKDRVFISGESYLKINENSVIIDRTSYDIKSIDNAIMVVHREEDKPFLIKIINESTIFCELERRYYYAKD